MQNLSTISLTTSSDKLFFGDAGHGISRYDVVKYPILDKIDDKMESFFWRPTEIDMSQERKDFQRMTDAERFVFTSNLRRQILLDSVQGRAPALVFLPWVTDSSLENCINTWNFMEKIHSKSYTHIIRAIYPDPAEVFEGIPGITEIVECATSVTQAYDNMINNPSKENLYLALIAANALEALRFYVSFACTFSFAERGLVEGSAKTIKLIQRDEAQHLALVQTILKLLPRDDTDFIQIAGDLNGQARQIFDEAAEQERQWAKFLFTQGSIMGLNQKILEQYVDYLLVKRKHAAGLTSTQKSRLDHPIPWIEKWFGNSNIQVAPQEVEVASYLTSSLENDIDSEEFTI